MTDTDADDVAGTSGLDDSPPITVAAHRWSGWPGAWCLDCGCSDPTEIGIGQGFGFDADGKAVPLPPEHWGAPCPEPGSKRHDPYAAILARSAPA